MQLLLLHCKNHISAAAAHTARRAAAAVAAAAAADAAAVAAAAAARRSVCFEKISNSKIKFLYLKFEGTTAAAVG